MENLGCEKALQVPATWIEQDEQWYNCPRRFISTSVSNFMNEYDLYKDKCATPPKYGDFGSKFLEAKNYFESMLNKFIEMKQGH